MNDTLIYAKEVLMSRMGYASGRGVGVRIMEGLTETWYCRPKWVSVSSTIGFDTAYIKTIAPHMEGLGVVEGQNSKK